MFYFFYKIILRLKKWGGDDIRTVYVYFNSLNETVNSHNWEAGNHTVRIIFVLHNENTLVGHSKRTFYPNYFIKELTKSLAAK